MRGELVGVWSEAWREIWEPLLAHDEASPDLACELYRSIAPALRWSSSDNAMSLPTTDDLQLEQAFLDAVKHVGTAVPQEQIRLAFLDSGAIAQVEDSERRTRAVAALSSLLGNEVEAIQLLDRALSKLAYDPKKRLEASGRAIDPAVLSNVELSRDALTKLNAADIVGERVLVITLEQVHQAMNDYAGDTLSNRFFTLLEAFIDKYSIRYELRRPCVLCPSLPGLFVSLQRRLMALGDTDANVARRLRDFREAVQDLRLGQTEGRIANCVSKQVMLLEAVAAASGTSGTDLKALSDSITNWPHPAVRASLLNLYGFASDFPGVRHGTPSSGMARTIDMRDLVAMSILLAGFTPYLSTGLDPEVVYRGA